MFLPPLPFGGDADGVHIDMIQLRIVKKMVIIATIRGDFAHFLTDAASLLATFFFYLWAAPASGSTLNDQTNLVIPK